MISRIVSTTDIVAEAPCSVPGDISSGCGRDWERQLSGSSSGGSGGQGAGGRGGRARNADPVDTELTGGDLGHGMGTLLHIAPLWSRAIIIVSVSCFIMM